MLEGHSIDAVASVGPQGVVVLPTLASAATQLAVHAGPVALGSLPAIGRWRRRRAESNRVRRILGADGDEVYEYRLPMRGHPLLNFDGPHPDDATAFAALAGPSLTHSRTRGWTEQEQVISHLSENIVCIGSPESEPLLRLVLGYRRRPGMAGTAYEGHAFRPAYLWCEDPTEVDSDCLRAVRGAGIVARPNWPLLFHKDGNTQRLIPQTDRQNFLIEDYLLITVLPNFLTRKGLSQGKRIISVAGIHGIGTAAIGRVLRSQKMLLNIGEGLPQTTPYFQVLARAHKIRHDQVLGATARALEIVDVVPIEVEYDTWVAAQGVCAQRFPDWLLEQHPFNDPPPHVRR